MDNMSKSCLGCGKWPAPCLGRTSVWANVDECFVNNAEAPENQTPFGLLERLVKCHCESVEVGSYGNQIWVHPPAHMPKENGYCLDRCIAEEVMQLWMRGITTTGCCCGHKKTIPFIGVIDADIPKMKAMGYKVAPNENRPMDEDSFYPNGI